MNDSRKSHSHSHSHSQSLSSNTLFGPKILNSPSMENLCIDSLDAPPSPLIRIHKDIVSMMDSCSMTDHDDERLLGSVHIQAKRDSLLHPFSSPSLLVNSNILTSSSNEVTSGNNLGNSSNNHFPNPNFILSSHSNSNGNNNGRSLWIGNLDPSINEQELRQIFEKYGKIESIRILKSGEHCAFVNFERIESAELAKQQLQGTPIGKTIIKIGNAKPNSIASTIGGGSISLISNSINPSLSPFSFPFSTLNSIGMVAGIEFVSPSPSNSNSNSNFLPFHSDSSFPIENSPDQSIKNSHGMNGIAINGLGTDEFIPSTNLPLINERKITGIGSMTLNDNYQNHISPPSSVTIIPPSTLNNKSIWIGNITNDITKEMIIKSFSIYGPVESCRILENKMCAFVNFHDSQNASTARMAMNGVRLGKTILRTGFAKGQGTTMTTSLLTCTPLNSISNSYSLVPSSSAFTVGLMENNFSLNGINDGNAGEFESILTLNGNEINGNNRINGINGNEIGNSKGNLNSKSNEFIFDNGDGMMNLNDGNVNCISMDSMGMIDPILMTMGKREISPIPIINPLPSSFESSSNQMMNTFALKELKRLLEHSNLTLSELVSLFTTQILPILIETCIDPLGNIVVQRAMERGDANLRTIIIHNLGPYLPALAIHKHGTWVIQKLLRFTAEESDSIGIEQRKYLIQMTSSYVVPLMHDAYGNYVVQCCLQFQDDNKDKDENENENENQNESRENKNEENESKEKNKNKNIHENEKFDSENDGKRGNNHHHNNLDNDGKEEDKKQGRTRGGVELIWEQIIKHCLLIATNRFGSRAIKSCLDHVTGNAANHAISNSFNASLVSTGSTPPSISSHGIHSFNSTFPFNYPSHSSNPSLNIKRMIDKFASQVIANLRILAFDSNGIIIVNWLLDYRGLKGKKYSMIMRELIKSGNLQSFLGNKSANVIIFKLIQQVEELAVHDILLREIMGILDLILVDNQLYQVLIRILQSIQSDKTNDWHGRIHAFLEGNSKKYSIQEYPWLRRLFEELQKKQVNPSISNDNGNGNSNLSIGSTLNSNSSSFPSTLNNQSQSNLNSCKNNGNANNGNQKLNFGSLPKEEYANDNSPNMQFVSFNTATDSIEKQDGKERVKNIKTIKEKENGNEIQKDNQRKEKETEKDAKENEIGKDAKEEKNMKNDKGASVERKSSLLLDPISRIDIFGNNFRINRFSSLQ